MLRLASKSKARRAMLSAAGVPFTLVDSAADENKLKHDLTAQGTDARGLAIALAKSKALGAAAGSDLVLGADQTLELPGGKMLHKPSSREEAHRQLSSLAGKSHWLHSAAALAREGRIVWSESETVSLKVRNLSAAYLDAYLDREYENVRWSVGCYQIEGSGVQLFESIEGSHFAILGLPLLPLLAFLRAEHVIPA